MRLGLLPVFGAFLTILSLCQASAVHADIVGVPRVIDGDTLDVSGVHIRLSGIDAPEMGQTCQAPDGQRWACGRVAKERLIAFIGHRPVHCDEQGQDRFGRTLGRCFLGAQDVQSWLVRQGLAVSFRRYSHDYDQDEDSARLGRVGLWAGEFDQPADWRRNKRY